MTTKIGVMPLTCTYFVAGAVSEFRTSFTAVSGHRSHLSQGVNDGDAAADCHGRVGRGMSAALVLDLAARLGGSTGTGHLAREGGRAAGLGLVEGWRGTIAHRVELDAEGRLSRVKVVDPSFFNWPALPLSRADTIVPDFPLANKSFNLSYAGNDL